MYAGWGRALLKIVQSKLQAPGMVPAVSRTSYSDRCRIRDAGAKHRPSRGCD